ncbi:MAG: chlorite dismutase family protein [Deltaproteobacteria bacterium]|nr:chlorite dismutase family protein [Deltaproteobacteria bacterium]
MSDEISRDERPHGRPLPGTEGHGTHSVDVLERSSVPRDGQPQEMNRRLFMQLLAFRCPSDTAPRELASALGAALDAAGASAVLYEDVNDPLGLALLSWSEDPTDFVDRVRPVLGMSEFRTLTFRPELTMLGRTYATGYEDRLDFWLLEKPVNNVRNPEWPWAVWYPLRRTGAFARLPGKDQGGILREHAVIGRAYGEAELAYDVRLACHGLDAHDNDFVIGLIGKTLHPLSHVVQTMRKTRQTSEFIEQMGPFFVGRRIWASR